ncbi:MAG: MFS transporter, partial [Candidatus Latescibacterota bacterium]
LPVAPVPLAGPFRRGLQALLADRRWRLFLFLAFTGGAGMGFVHHFLFLYMDGIGASRTTMGMALSVATLSELAVFGLAHRWLDRWGVHRVLAFAMLATAARLLGYAALPHPGWVLLLQLLHGPTFALMWTAGVAGASRLAPPGLGATAQGLFTGVNFGLGGAFGALLGGVLYEQVGALSMYALAGAGVLGSVLAYLALSRGGRALALESG